MTLRLYAGRKGWTLNQVEVVLTYERLHGRDCELLDDPEAQCDHIRRRITLYGDLDEEQRQRMAYIATRCPVEKTLHSPTHIEDEVVLG